MPAAFSALLLILALALGGCDLVQDPDSETTTEKSKKEKREEAAALLPPLPELVCNEGPARDAVIDTGFADQVTATAKARLALAGEPETDANRLQFAPDGPYEVAQLDCADLTGDEVEEMVVSLSDGPSGKISDWAIFTPSPEGVWALALGLEGARVKDLEVKGEEVRFSTPIGGGESRQGTASFTGKKFTVEVPGSRGRKIEIKDDAVTGLGRLDAQSASIAEGTKLFGPPTSVRPDGTLCEARWDDLGLTINFANFGIGDPCGADGRVGAIELLGGYAAAAGWTTSEGISVGSRTGAVRKAYPDAKRRQGQLLLVERESPVGASGSTPTMAAVALAGRVLALRLFVGAGGE